MLIEGLTGKLGTAVRLRFDGFIFSRNLQHLARFSPDSGLLLSPMIFITIWLFLALHILLDLHQIRAQLFDPYYGTYYDPSMMGMGMASMYGTGEGTDLSLLVP